jgi:PRTRC genetic system ThiF family protein
MSASPQSLKIDLPIPFVLAQDAPICVVLAGCGGTGSHIAQSLARVAKHAREAGLPPIVIVLVDPDRIERKNIGRQLFSDCEVGFNKAQALAVRFSSAFGMMIDAVPEAISLNILDDIATSLTDTRNTIGILVGAVDSAAGRQVLHEALSQRSFWRIWINAGNHESTGQVITGTVTTAVALRGALKLGSICSQLPAASLIYPDLLLPDPEPQPRPDCAQAMAMNLQSLMVNQAMAAVVAQYLYQLIVKRQLAQFLTEIDVESLVMHSTSITANTLATATGLTVNQLKGLAT